MKKIKKYKNGAILVYKHQKAKATSVIAGFVFGRNRDKYNNALAHFCEHMFFVETEKRNKEKLRKEKLKTFTMLNGRTNLFYTEIDFCRSNKALEPSFELASDMLLHSKY